MPTVRVSNPDKAKKKKTGKKPPKKGNPSVTRLAAMQKALFNPDNIATREFARNAAGAAVGGAVVSTYVADYFVPNPTDSFTKPLAIAAAGVGEKILLELTDYGDLGQVAMWGSFITAGYQLVMSMQKPATAAAPQTGTGNIPHKHLVGEGRRMMEALTRTRKGTRDFVRADVRRSMRGNSDFVRRGTGDFVAAQPGRRLRVA